MTNDADTQIYRPSPEVHLDGSATFRLFAPAAHRVKLVSNVNELSGELVRHESGVWEISVGPLPPDTYAYYFSVDGARVLDPVNRATKSWIWMDSVVTIPPPREATDHSPIHYQDNVPHGTLHLEWYRSELLNQTRRVFVYTPPGYSTSQGTYPVLYLLHGFGDDESAWTSHGQAHTIADNMIARGESVAPIIVMPCGHDSIPQDPDYLSYPLQENTKLMETELLQGIIPFIENRYRCNTTSQDRAIAGLSMGGGQALTIGINNLDRFQWIAGFSSSIDKLDVKQAALHHLPDLQTRQPLIWLSCGRDDFLFEENTAFDAWLSEHSIPHLTRLTDGDHNWRCWRQDLAEFLSKLFHPIYP